MILYLSDGSLGNQLFQYAFLTTIAKDNERIFAFNMRQFVDYFDYKNKNFRHVSVGKHAFIVLKLIKSIVLLSLVKLRIIGHLKQNRAETSALPSVSKRRGLLPIRLVEGYFQAEEFFQEKKIDFKVKQKYINKAEEFLKQVPSNLIRVFVHVRRGDYVSESYLGRVGINLPKRYFNRAIKTIISEVKNPFYIFLSDDPDFVETCFADIKNKIVSRNKPVVDFSIMTLCEYGIVSNSTFSWWGAYLMANRKKVIFPKYWYGWKLKVESHIGIQPEWAEVIEV